MSPGGRAAHRDPVLRGELRVAIRGACGAAVRRGYLEGRTPSRARCAITSSSSTSFSTWRTRCRRGRIATGHYAQITSMTRPGRTRCGAASTMEGPDILPLRSDTGAARADAVSDRRITSRRSANSLGGWAFRSRRRATARKSASFRTAITQHSSTRISGSRESMHHARAARSSPDGKRDRRAFRRASLTVGQRKGLGHRLPRAAVCDSDRSPASA